MLGDLIVEVAAQFEEGASDGLDLVHARSDLGFESLDYLSYLASTIDPFFKIGHRLGQLAHVIPCLGSPQRLASG